ncbi:MAG: DegT/DnrJ/EryC1/StrS family aminotransferase [Acholeplasma sp.]|nr:DegT/DnrJ/EryC1/StrS family aminotransferase [Acholeplasma sp.]
MEFRDLKKQYLNNKDAFDKAISQVISEVNFISGKEVTLLEESLANFVGVKHCITCANGTDALSMVLTVWNVGPGDAVFVPNFTFFATAEVVAYVGATPIFVDIDEKTFNMDPIHLEKQILSVITSSNLKPKVIIPVDLFGLLADYEKIENIARKYNLLLLEDGAQGFGAEWKGRKACSFGNAATTSFFPAKPLGCYGDGGAIFTNDDNLALRLNSYKVHGKGDSKYDNVVVGVNSRLDTLQAAVLIEKLHVFTDFEMIAVQDIYNHYTTRLKEYVITPFIPENYISSFAQYTIQLRSKCERDSIQLFLKSKGIPTMIYYNKTMANQKAFSYLNNNDIEYPISSKIVDKVLSLPFHPYLTLDEITFVTDSVIDFLKDNR